jgi:hypothetical protein
MSAFKATNLGITAFMTSLGADFVLDGPDMETSARVSKYNAFPEAVIKLDGKRLTITELVASPTGAIVQIKVRWNRKDITLGLRKKAAGTVSYYGSVEAGEFGAPKSDEAVAAHLHALMGVVAAPDTEEEDDDIPF